MKYVNEHKWVPSTLGHGGTMCAKCLTTNLEAEATGTQNICSVIDEDYRPRVSLSKADVEEAAKLVTVTLKGEWEYATPEDLIYTVIKALGFTVHE